jgi:hypothetical protein
MTGGEAFTQPGNPGIYPTGLAPNAAVETRVEDIRPGLTPHTVQSPPPDIPETLLEQAPRVRNEKEVTVSEKDKIIAINRDQIKGNIRNLAMRRARIPQRHQREST